MSLWSTGAHTPTNPIVFYGLTLSTMEPGKGYKLIVNGAHPAGTELVWR